MASDLSIALAALYLRGGPRCGSPSVRAWPSVVAVLRASGGRLPSAPEALRRQGLWAEALLLEDSSLVAWAEATLAAGQAMTAACGGWPARWRAAFPGGGPAAMWVSGPMPSGPFLAVVGSRALSGAAARYARSVGAEAARLGLCVVSGGASGADRAAAEGALAAGGAVLEMLPCGLEAGRGTPGACWASVSSPDAPFAGARAMERNALIYAAAVGAVVVAARYREGGTWQGATEALRRRSTRLFVRPVATCRAVRALMALGALPLAAPSGLGSALSDPPPSLFAPASGGFAAFQIGEPRAAYVPA